MTAVCVTPDRLSDGREIFYYDEDGGRPRPRDLRGLPTLKPQPNLRYDALVAEWVTVADHRQDRTLLPPDDECPLCPSSDGRTTEIPAEKYDVVVFENRFPAFVLAPDARSGAGAELLSRRPARGRCEIICFTADHAASFSSLSETRVRTILGAWIERTETLSRLPCVEQVFCFENRGEEIGVTLSHPHGQIYAYPFVTPRSDRMLACARDHRRRTGGNLFADVLAGELESGERVVVRGEYWNAFVPFAARWPVELHLYLNRRVCDLADLSEDERAEFPIVYLELLHRIEAAYGSAIPYISAWHQAPVRRDRDLAYLHLQLFSIRRAPDKLKYLAGSESAMGAFINDLTPEETARTLREVPL